MTLKLQLLLRKEHRNEQSTRAVQNKLAELSIRPTAAGAATVSAEMEAPDFERVFGRQPEEPEAPGNPASLGLREQSGTDLPIPDGLRDYVDSITVAPSYLRMGPADGIET